MSIPRLLGIIVLALFIVFVASFFSVLVRLSRIGVVAERYALIGVEDIANVGPVYTRIDIIGQAEDSGRLITEIITRIDLREAPFSLLNDGDVLKLRIQNLVPELKRNTDLEAVFHQPPDGEDFVNLNFGTFEWDVLDRRDFYPFDANELSFNYAYYVRNDNTGPQGTWFQPETVEIRCLTNMILINARYAATAIEGEAGFRVRAARLRILQYFTITLILIEVLFIVYLLTISNLQDLIAKGLGYLVGLFIVREVLVTNAPQFPTLVDYSTMFLICVVFFLMLFKFLGGAEEHALITFPPTWRETFYGQEKSGKDEGETRITHEGASEEDSKSQVYGD